MVVTGDKGGGRGRLQRSILRPCLRVGKMVGSCLGVVMNKPVVLATRRCFFLVGLLVVAGCSWKAQYPDRLRTPRRAERGLDHRNPQPGPRRPRARQDDRELVYRRRIARPGLCLDRRRAGTVVLGQLISSRGHHQVAKTSMSSGSTPGPTTPRGWRRSRSLATKPAAGRVPPVA